MLVHGAWADGSSWARVTTRLQRAGYPVHVPPNPLRGLASDSAYLASFLATIKGPIVLVGHSYGGSVITDAATGNPSVSALVYVNAFIPDEGETVLQLAGAEPGSKLSDPAKAFDFVPYPGAVGGDVDLYVKPSVFHAYFAADQSKEEADMRAAVQRPLAASALQAESTAPAWKTIRSWAVIGTDDQVIPPAEQVVMARRAAPRPPRSRPRICRWSRSPAWSRGSSSGPHRPADRHIRRRSTTSPDRNLMIRYGDPTDRDEQIARARRSKERLDVSTWHDRNAVLYELLVQTHPSRESQLS